MLDRILSTLAPHTCSSCGEPKGLLCDYCFSDIIDNGYDQCVVCLRPSASDNLCSGCRAHAVYDAAWVVGVRTGGLRELIDRYKFDRARDGARVLARLLDACLPVLPPTTTISYIPTISSHMRQRGYDHMAYIARELAKRRHMPVGARLQRRTALPQRGASKADRLIRQHGAFSVDDAVTSPVLLIDDIYTTGATLESGVTAIRAVSTQPVFVAVIARQPFDR